MARGNPNGVPNSKATQFKKGNCANPKGAPKKIPAIDELLADVLADEQNGISAAKAIIIGLRNSAIKGNVKAAELILDRAYGKSKQNIIAEVKSTFDPSKYTAEEILFLAEIKQKGESNGDS